MAFLDKIVRRDAGSAGLSALPRDLLAGVIAGFVTIAYCLSFAALIFQGTLAGGLPLGLSALLTGTAMIGTMVAFTTTLAPADAGPDTPAVAVMSVMAASIAAQFASVGLSMEAAVVHVMMAITVSTLITGLILVAVGSFGLGVWLRFVPYPVVGGFLAASGWLLVTGGIEVMSDVDPSSFASIKQVAGSVGLWPLLAGLGFAGAVFLVRQRIDSVLVLPVTFFVALVTLDTALLGGGLMDALGGRGNWFLNDVGPLKFWTPVAEAMGTDIDWGVLAANAAEIGAVCGVTAVSLLLDVTSLEVARRQSADLDTELRTTGWANVITGLTGGVTGNLSLSSSILLTEAGAMSRASGVFSAAVCLIVLILGIDIGAVVPKPLLGGLLVYLGFVILMEAFLHSPAQRSRTDLLLAAAIMAVIIYFGYLLGVLMGVIGACLLFAFSYSRIGVVRRHLTRQDFASNVDRSPSEARLLRENGAEIHVFWLSGFIFFGSSNGLFEYVRRCIEHQTAPQVHHVVLDFGAVPGLDTSAVLSLVKLRNYCDARSVVLVFAGLSDKMQLSFEAAGFFGGGSPHMVFATRNEGVEWCENRLLSEHDLEDVSEDKFEDWLAGELGGSVDVERLLSYFERIELDAGETLFKEGDPADSVDVMGAGCVAITITDEQGRRTRLKRMSAQTVVGEMGFYRGAPRTASVIADEPTVVYRLTRQAFERMQAEDAVTASAFHRLIVRVLSDRLEFANREVAALL